MILLLMFLIGSVMLGHVTAKPLHILCFIIQKKRKALFVMGTHPFGSLFFFSIKCSNV